MKTSIYVSSRPPTALLPGLLAGLALMVGVAQAQTSSPRFLPLDMGPTAQVLDPQTTVPPASYQSSLTGVKRGVDDVRLDWRRANDEVGQFKRGHIDLLKLEQPPVAGQPTGTTP